MNVYLALAAAAALPAAALAQQEDRTAAPAAPSPAARTTPELNGHVFVPSVIIDTPFRSTTFKLSLLYGFGDATGPKYDINTGQQIGTNSYTFASFAQAFRYEYQFFEWLSAGAVVLTSLYSGIDGPSVVSIGAQVALGFGVRLRAGKRFGPVETAIIVDASNSPEYGVLVAAALIKALQDHVIDAGTALQSTHTRTVNPVVAASWAPLPALGLTANAGYVFKSLRVSGTSIGDQNGFQVGGMIDFDFGKISSVPVGLIAAYRLTTPLGDSGVEKIDEVSGGIFYTARRELGLGAEIGWRSFTIRPPLDSSGALAQIVLQYYW